MGLLDWDLTVHVPRMSSGAGTMEPEIATIGPGRALLVYRDKTNSAYQLRLAARIVTHSSTEIDLGPEVTLVQRGLSATNGVPAIDANDLAQLFDLGNGTFLYQTVAQEYMSHQIPYGSYYVYWVRTLNMVLIKVGDDDSITVLDYVVHGGKTSRDAGLRLRPLGDPTDGRFLIGTSSSLPMNQIDMGSAMSWPCALWFMNISGSKIVIGDRIETPPITLANEGWGDRDLIVSGDGTSGLMGGNTYLSQTTGEPNYPDGNVGFTINADDTITFGDTFGIWDPAQPWLQIHGLMSDYLPVPGTSDQVWIWLYDSYNPDGDTMFFSRIKFGPAGVQILEQKSISPYNASFPYDIPIVMQSGKTILTTMSVLAYSFNSQEAQDLNGFTVIIDPLGAPVLSTSFPLPADAGQYTASSGARTASLSLDGDVLLIATGFGGQVSSGQIISGGYERGNEAGDSYVTRMELNPAVIAGDFRLARRAFT